jgi:hypothetical protein
MTVGTPDYNLDSFGIKYVKKDERATGSTPSTEKTPHGLDKPKDKLDLAGNSPTSSGDNIDTTTSYGEGSTGTQGEGKNQGDKAEMTGIGGTKKNPNSNAQGNQVNFKKPEGQALPKNASMELAIIKCKLLKANSALKKGMSGAANFNKKETLQESAENYLKEPKKESVDDSAKEYLKEKGTGDKIPAEKLGDLPQGKDDKKVGGTEIEDKDGKSKKLESPADRYKSEVREMAIDAIDMAMKTIAVYQDAKEKAIQEELIKDAYEAQKEAGATNTSDGGSVNFTYSDVHQRTIETLLYY